MRHYLIYFVAMWVIHLINMGLGGALNVFGVNKIWGMLLTQFTGDSQTASILSIPLTILGFFAHPFLHGNDAHILSNSFGYLPLGLLVLSIEGENFKVTFWKMAFITGALTWLISPPNTIAVGASGIIFGLIGHLLANSIFNFNFFNVMFAIGAFVISGNFWGGMFPQNVGQGVSWQGHLAGFISGGIVVFLNARQPSQSAPAPQEQSMFSNGFPFN